MLSLPILQTLRLPTILSLPLNLAASALGWALLSPILRHSLRDACPALVPVIACAAAAAAKVLCTIGTGVAQGMVASTISRRAIGERSDERDFHLVARTRYRRWLWWTRLGIFITVIQLSMAIYLVIVVANDLTSDASYNACFKGKDSECKVISMVVITWIVALVQCVTGSDVLRWRSFYASHDTAWRAHYREVFDHGIREALCCLGRAKYLSVMEHDEVYTVARLLGDLMAYRASGTGHLELLAGLALLQKHNASPAIYDGLIEAPLIEAPINRVKEAVFFHKYAEAAYTGPLLDFGRHPLLFPCVWIYRQGTFTPWTRTRRPHLEGDNWWRGHAAAFLNYVNLPPNSLLKGRVSQSKREAAYFVVVLHEIKTIVIAIRGTETPEDLITDGLWGDCSLNMDDLDGLIKSDKVDPLVRQNILASFPHYGHSGIVESAREIYKNTNGKSDAGCLSSLLGEGRECYGYKIRIVGHSLGGSVATLLGIMLYGQYPNLHVYSYGPLPCLDPILAESCSTFVTSIVYNDEFSSRLSVNSIFRLRAAAVSALSSDSSTNSALISNFLKKIININNKTLSSSEIPMTQISSKTANNNININNNNNNSSSNNNNTIKINNGHISHAIKGGAFICGHAMACMMHSDPNLHRNSNFETISPNNLQESINGNYSSCQLDNHHDHNNDTNTNGVSIIETCGAHWSEMYLPGLIVHILRCANGDFSNSILKSLISDRNFDYKAFVVNKERFMDVVVSPYMFLDHLPWRCNYALQKAFKSLNKQKQEHTDLFTEDSSV